MSNRQLEQLRETLDLIVEDLCHREQAVDQEQAHLVERLNELDERQSHLKSLEEVVTAHQASESQLAARLETLVAALDERTAAQPQWMSGELEKLEQRLIESLLARWPQTAAPPTLHELSLEMERTQSKSVQTLTEQLTASLQTAISVQLAPLTDDLPERLASAVSSAAPVATPSLPIAMPELARELEKFESRSMASMAARMTAGLQTALANQWSALTAELPTKIAEALANSPALANQHALAGPTPTQEAIEPRAAADQASSHEAHVHEAQSQAAHESQIEELKGQLEQTRKSLAETEALLTEALEHPHVHEDAKEGADPGVAQSEDALVEALRLEVAELRSLLTVKERDSVLLDELRDEVVRLRRQAAGDQSPEIHRAEDELRERLEHATCELIDLRSQNEELAERVTRLQVSTAPHGPMPHLGQEGLSWEERKRLLLQQLDAEQDEADAPAAEKKRLEVEDILKTTDVELARRDREIAELRSLLQQQADARQGMAVGAAAVAQLVESDELVQEEREKLRGMQRSWDEKFRQAEIDLSMERAKLARERSQLEEQKQQLEEALHATAQAAAQGIDPKDKNADPKGRKWLSRLGLKDEK